MVKLNLLDLEMGKLSDSSRTRYSEQNTASDVITQVCLSVYADLHCDSEHRGDRCKRQRPAVRFLTASEPHCHRRAGQRLRRTGQGRKRQTHKNKDREAAHLVFFLLIHSDGLHCVK